MKPALKFSLLVLVLLAALPAAPAEEPEKVAPLTGKVELRFLRSRSGAPIPVVWELDWNEQAILEGYLDYEVENGNQALGRFRLSDLVLSPGKNVFNAMLPTFTIYSNSVPVTVRARFISGKRSFDLDEQSLRVPNLFAQWFNIGIVSSATRKSSPEELRLLDAMHWERFLPKDTLDASTTASMDLDTASLPNEPLALCNFDVIILRAPALVELRDDQADALKKWVNAGGSVCLVAGGGLNPRHAALINGLLDESSTHEAFVVNSRGFLAPGGEFAGEIVSARKGLGRVVVLREALWETLKPDAKEWLAATEFLMKIRRRRIDGQAQGSNMPWTAALSALGLSVPPPGAPQPNVSPKGRGGKTGNPRTPIVPNPNVQTVPGRNSRVGPAGQLTANQLAAMRMQYDPSALRSGLSPAPFAAMSGLYQVLMPKDVQMVPLGLIALILAAYVVAIGPIDYFLLGLLRMRRFTWILFPVVTIAFAGFTLWLSRWYLGTNDSRQGIEICDVVKGGTTARRTRIELVFFSRERDLGTEIQNGAFSQVGVGATEFPRMAFSATNDMSGANRATYVGRIPGRYVVEQSVPQWTPIVNRFFWIDPKPVPSEKTQSSNPEARFDWDDPGDPTTANGRAALAARIRNAFGGNVCAEVYRNSGELEAVPIINSFGFLRKPRLPANSSEIQYGLGDVVRELSVREPRKLFSIASQIAPSGSPELEDLAILDGSDPGQSLLVITVDTGSDILIYRRLYAGGS
jgi:hypothetical protein